MHFKIHRGTQEIGGSCVEIWTENTRIVLDIGMPLLERDGTEFDFKKYANDTVADLIQKNVLPNIKGFYADAKNLVDGVLISHSHIDHYQLIHLLLYLELSSHKAQNTIYINI